MSSKHTHSVRSRFSQQSYFKFSTDEKEEDIQLPNSSNYGNNSLQNLRQSFTYESGISSEELNKFAEKKKMSKDVLNSIIWCFHYEKWDSHFFAKARLNDKLYFKNILSTLYDIRAGVATELWLKCVRNNNYTFVSDIKQEEETDIDLSFLSVAKSHSSPNNTVPKLDVLNRINSDKDIAIELVCNRSHKHPKKERSHNIKYINASNNTCNIRFDYKDYGSDKNEKKNKKKGSNWIGWILFQGIWITDANVEKRVDIHIHVNVYTGETCVNIELYPHPYSPTGETYWENEPLKNIGKMFSNKTNNYVCSKWITNYMRRMLKQNEY